jgi:hypothetical protein
MITLYLDTQTRRFRKGIKAGTALESLTLKRGDDLVVPVQFVTGFEAVTAGSGATGKLAIKSAAADTEFLALDAAWTAPGSGETAYTFALDLFTEEVETAFEDEPASISGVLEIEWVTSTETLSSVSLPVTIENHVIRGSEGTPTPATSPTPVVEVIADVPDAKDDFFMFPGGVAPTTGMYMASDANYNYTMKGGWAYWRRAAIAMWLLLAAMTLATGAQYDMPYIQRDGSGDNQERVVTLTPSTFLSVSANGTLQVQSGVNFKTSLGLATVATSGNYSDLSGNPAPSVLGIESLAMSAGFFDWSKGSHFFHTLANNTTFQFSNVVRGKTVTFSVTGNGVHGVNWPFITWLTGIPGVPKSGTTMYRVTAITETVLIGEELAQPNSPLPVSVGGTGSTSATAARTALGLGTLATQNGTFSGTSSGTNTGDQTIISFTTAPATSTSNGTQGTLIQEGNWLYICVATNTWRRIELLNW